MLFGKRGKYEIRVRNRQEAQLGLAALCNTFAPGPARPHRDLRLNQLIASPLGIAFRVEETDDTCFLICLQGDIADRENYQCHHRYRHPVLPWHAREEYTDREYR